MMDSVMHFGSDLSQRLALDATPYPDSNNNSAKSSMDTRGDKYSLRPRSLRRPGSDEDDVKTSPATATTAKSRGSKPKQKPAPLSKYRRKTANARERSRMREINAAFEALRRAVPHLQCPGAAAAVAAASTNEKLTKITTLRLAMKYISALSSALKDPGTAATGASATVDFGDLLSDCSDLDCLFFESDGESLQLHSDLSDHSLTSVDFKADCTDNSSTSYNFGDHPFASTFNEHSPLPFDSFFAEFS